MSSYRQHGFDPNAYEQPGRPLRPYNWVQWIGVAMAVAGIGVNLAYFAGEFGWTRPVIDNPSPAMALILPAIVLVNSRREPGNLVSELQRQRNRRVLVITVLVCAIVIGAAVAIELLGVN